MLIALDPDRRVAAEQAQRGLAFRCPECGEAVVLKQGRIVVAHFAHRRASACAWASGETAEHLGAKRGIAAAFAARGLSVEIEAEVLSNGGDRRADLLVRHPRTGAPVAIEVQHSPLALDAIERRTRAYLAAGACVVWVATLDCSKAGLRQVSPGVFVVERYAAPAWQRFAAEYQGSLWFWSQGTLWRGWLDPAWVSEASVSDSGANLFRQSRRWTALTLEGPYPPEAVRVQCFVRACEIGEDFSLPGGMAARLRLNGERGPARSPTRQSWSDRDGRVALRIEPRMAA